MEELILRYYLSLFSVIFLLIIYLLYFIFYRQLDLNSKILSINKNESIENITNKIFINENYINKKLINYFFLISNNFVSQINYGKFKIKNNFSIASIYKIISKKSNFDYRITLIEGWEYYQFDEYISDIYEQNETIPYNELIADTYIINSSNSFKDFKKFLLSNKKIFFDKHRDNALLKKYGIDKILIISSLVEKEGKNIEDKRLISSVIFNRLNKGMKLQIDATVIASITKGQHKLERKLNYDDLKIDDSLNTYVISGIPYKMISYVGPKTIELVLENNKSDFLFYFYNIIEKKHIFSLNFNKHKNKLNEYRKKIK